MTWVFLIDTHEVWKNPLVSILFLFLRSDVAILYNDRSVLENHHVSAAYRLMQEEEMNVLINLSKDDWRWVSEEYRGNLISGKMLCDLMWRKQMKVNPLITKQTKFLLIGRLVLEVYSGTRPCRWSWTISRPIQHLYAS